MLSGMNTKLPKGFLVLKVEIITQATSKKHLTGKIFQNVKK